MAYRILPMAKKPFITNTIEALNNVRLDMLRAEPQPIAKPETYSDDWVQLAYQLYDVAVNLYDKRSAAVYGVKWQRWSYVYDTLYRAPRIGDVVAMRSTRWDQSRHSAIGQLVNIDRMPRNGSPRRYEDDGGPANIELRYTLRLLDGTLQKWINSDPFVVPTIRHTSVDEKTQERMLGRRGSLA